MAFLNGVMLMGALAVGIPIIIHFLNKRKFNRVIWAAMRFLQVSIQQNQRRMQLEDLLLLALRCLLLGLLALALARPALRSATASGWFGQSKVTAVLVLDNSYSMSQTDGVSSRFERAQLALVQAIDAMPGGSSVAVLLASDITKAVIPQPTYDLDLARKAIRSARLCDRGTNLYSAVTSSIDLLRKSGAVAKEIFIATDGQESGFSQLDDMVRALDDTKGDVRCHFLLCGQKETSNLSVSNISMGTDIPAVGQPHAFDVEITNWGTQEQDSVRVTLSNNNDPPSAEGIIDMIGAGQSKWITLSSKVRDEGYQTVTAALPADHLPADDTRTAAFRGFKKVNVLLVDGEPGSEPRDSEVFFLRRALAPVRRAEAADYLVQCTRVVPGDLAGRTLDNFQVMVLANVADLAAGELDAIATFVKAGGALMIFPGGNTQADYYNSHLLKETGLLPAELLKATGDEKDDKKFSRISSKNLQHPIASVWTDPAAGDVGAAHFFRRYLLKPIDKPGSPAIASAGAASVVLWFDDEQPFMVERQFGQGRVVLFASTAGTRWNDLPDHPGLYVSLLYRTLGWLVLQRDRTLNIPVGERWIFHPDLSALNRTAIITRPKSTGEQRDSRTVEMSSDNLPALTYDDTDLGGPYTVAIPGQPVVKFAAQPDKNESSLVDISDAQKQKLSQSAAVIDWRPGIDLSGTMDKERVGIELFMPLAVLLLLTALVETFLADWFSRAK